MKTAFVVLAIVVVLILAGYAGWLHYRLWKLKRRPASGVAVFDPGGAGGSAHRPALRKTLYVLADALVNDKMTHTEGCLRICAMANNLEDNEGFRREFGVLFRVAEATAHFPILDGWQALSRDEQRRMTRERIAIEEKYRDAVIDAAHRVRETMREK